MLPCFRSSHRRIRSLCGGAAAALLSGIVVLPFLHDPLRAQDTSATQPAGRSAPIHVRGHQDRRTAVGKHYYVEFRAALIGAYGHSYAVYGISGGQPNYADLHPMGGYIALALGHLVSVPANTQWDPDVLALPITSRYRLNLSAQQYRNLVAAVHAARNKTPYWNAVTNNCNNFVGDLAQAIGLKIPSEFQLSYAFVPALKELNEGGSAGTVKPPGSGGRRAAVAPRS